MYYFLPLLLLYGVSLCIVYMQDEEHFLADCSMRELAVPTASGAPTLAHLLLGAELNNVIFGPNSFPGCGHPFAVSTEQDQHLARKAEHLSHFCDQLRSAGVCV